MISYSLHSYTLLNLFYQVDEHFAFLEMYDNKVEEIDENDILVHDLHLETNFPYGFEEESESDFERQGCLS